MIIGVPKEIKAQENRIALTPFGVEHLTNLDHTVLLEHDGGVECGFLDRDYEKVGAEIVTSTREIFRQSELIVKVKEPQPPELDMIQEDQVMFANCVPVRMKRGRADFYQQLTLFQSLIEDYRQDTKTPCIKANLSLH